MFNPLFETMALEMFSTTALDLIEVILPTSERKELRVDILKRVLSNEARGTLGLEAAVHSLNLVLRKSGCLAQRR